MALTPARWWRAVPDDQRPAWRTAALGGALPPDLAGELEAAGFLLPRHGGLAFLPPQIAEVVLTP